MPDFSTIFDYWLPKKLPEKEHDRVKISVFIKGISAITFVGCLTSILTATIFSEGPSRIYFVGTALLSVALYFIILTTVKKTGNLELAYNIGAAMAIVFMSRLIFDSGGIYSSSILSIWVILIASFFIASIRTGILWSVLVIVYIFLFYVLEVLNYIDYKAHLDSPSRRVIDLIFITSYISVVLIIYERNRKGMLERMNKAHAELKKQNKSLIELNREKENLMAIVAHDLKAPQNQVLAIFKLLEMELKDKNIPTEYIETGKNIVNGSLNLINDITYAREITSGYLIQKKERLMLTSFMEETIRSFESSASEKNIKIIPDIKTNGASIDIDKTILKRILENLISNAIKFSPFNKRIFIGSTVSENKLIVSVKDEGPGIAKEEQKLLFKRFQKLSARPTNKESSSGLGLYIVKTLTDKVGGTIEVVSEKDKGAEFKLILTASKQQSSGV